jgi:hypothetical protein
MHHRA